MQMGNDDEDRIVDGFCGGMVVFDGVFGFVESAAAAEVVVAVVAPRGVPVIGNDVQLLLNRQGFNRHVPRVE